MTNKRLYLVSWSTAIKTSRRRGWCSYIELLSTCHFGLPEEWPLYYIYIYIYRDIFRLLRILTAVALTKFAIKVAGVCL